jgi:hypothetical protein
MKKTMHLLTRLILAHVVQDFKALPLHKPRETPDKEENANIYFLLPSWI